MKSSVETLSPTRVKLTVEVPFDELNGSLAEAYKRIAAQVNVPGFRKGKVPAAIIDQRIGRGAVLDEAVNEALPRAYDSAVAENEIVALGQPNVDITELADGDKLVFTAEVDVRPEFDLPDYTGIKVAVDDKEVASSAVEEQLDALRKRFATATPVARAAQDEDLALIDVEGLLDGEKVDDFSATALSYEVGSGGMVAGADEALRGLSEGESATFSFTPDEGDYDGKEITVTVKVQGVRERCMPDADDEFAQLASEFDTLEELRDDLRIRVERMALVEQGMAAREKVMEALLELIDLPVPDGLVEAQLGEHFEDGHGDGGHRGEVEANVRKSIKTQFILDKIADSEDVSVGQAELTQWLVSQAPQYGLSPDQFADALVQAGQVPMAVADVRRGKALALVLQKADVTDASGNAVNLTELDRAVEEEVIEEAIEEAEEEAVLEEAIAEAVIAEAVIEEAVIEESQAKAAADSALKE